MSPRFLFLAVSLALLPGLSLSAQTRQTMGDAFEKKTKNDKKGGNAAGEWSAEDKKRLMSEVTDELFADGLKARQAGRLGEAQTLFERILILDPGHQAAKAQVVEIKRKTETASKPPKKTPKDDTARLLTRFWGEADGATRAGEWDDAQLALKKILAIDPANKKARAKLDIAERNYFAQLAKRGEERERAGDFEGALDTYQLALAHGDDAGVVERVEKLKAKLAETNRKKSDDLYVAALSASQQGNDDKALTLCRHALRLDPTNLQAQRMLERLKNRAR